MKGKKYINFKAIGLSLIFLFNPNINVIDFLPDFIGYIILCALLTNLADINETVSEALGIFKKMIFIDAAKLVALIWIFGMSVTTEKNSSLLLWSFAFGILEMLFVIPAFLKLFKGLGELGYLYDNTSINEKNGNRKKNYTDSLRRFTVAFIAIKSIMAFLPEFADLTSTEYSENQGITNLYEHIGIMRFLAFVPVLVLGVIWIVKVILYFNRINNDVKFNSAIDQIYRSRVLNKSGIFVKRNIKLSFVLLLLVAVFSFDLRIESVNVLPDFISAILVFAFFCVVSKRTSINKKISVTVATVYFVTAVAATVTEFLFFKNYYYESIYRAQEAMQAFVVMATFAVINIAVFAIACVMMLMACDNIIKEHTGGITVSNDKSNEYQLKMSEALHADLRRSLIFCAASTFVYLVTDACYVLLAKDYGFMLFINVIGFILFIASFIKAYSDISEAVEAKYILE